MYDLKKTVTISNRGYINALNFINTENYKGIL